MSMVVVPHKPGALVIGVVILGLAGLGSGIENLTLFRKLGRDCRAESPPVVGAAVADPGHMPAVQMHRGAVAWLASGKAGTPPGMDCVRLCYDKLILKGNLDGLALLGHDDAA